MASNSAYRRNVLTQKYFITSTVVILVHEITKEEMTETLYNKVIKVSGVYGIEETNLTKNRGK